MQSRHDAAAPSAVGTELARAKVNLFLHVRGRRPEGYHTLESFVVFPETGDLVTARVGAGVPEALSLNISGPFAAGLSSGSDNLALAAAAALCDRMPARPGAALDLVKSLPVAAGIGGGSADAGAVLRLLARLWPSAPVDDLSDIAFALGADAPMCLVQRPALVGGVGERMAPAPAFPPFWVVLVNPMVPLSTAEVFGALAQRTNPAGAPPPARLADLGELVSWLGACRNDLEPPARALCPVIGRCLSALTWRTSCRFARMSGSGATCFGIFETAAEAEAAAADLGRQEPGWWVTAAPVHGWDGQDEY